MKKAARKPRKAPKRQPKPRKRPAVETLPPPRYVPPGFHPRLAARAARAKPGEPGGDRLKMIDLAASIGPEEKVKHDHAGMPRKIDDTRETRRLIIAMGKVQCSYEEVGAAFGCSAQSVLNFFKRSPEVKELFDAAKYQGTSSLRVTQFRMAQSNPAMAIWLGKQLLGQKDNPALGEGSGPIADSNDAKDKLERSLNAEFATGRSESPDKRLN